MEPRSLSWLFRVTMMSFFRSSLTANNYNCDGPLVSALPGASFQSSSLFSSSLSPHFARLNGREGEGGWAPQQTDRRPWLQVDLRERLEVTAVATQGRQGSSDWVSSYLLLYSDTGRAWKEYRLEDGVWAFPGNRNADGVAHHKLPHSIRTRFLRFVPLSWNPSGRVGLRVEAYGCTYKSDVADFDGRSALLYRFNQKSMSTVKDVISLWFKSQKSEGVLVHGEGQRGDYITLELHQGRLVLRLNLDSTKLRPGGPHALVTLGSLLDDQHWHSVLVERFNKQVNFTVDAQTHHFRTQGDGGSLEVDYELGFGGVPLPGKPGTFLRKNFHGCMENLYYNGVNVIDLAKRRKPQIYSVGNVSFSCSEPQDVAVTFLSSGSSFLWVPVKAVTGGSSLRFQFRTWNSDGLLLSVPLTQAPDHLLQLLLRHGQLILILHGLPGVSMEHRLNDGMWHSVSLGVWGRLVSVSLDHQLQALTLELEEHLHLGDSCFFGGCPRSSNILGCRNPTLAFQGCMRQIVINNHTVNLLHVQQGSLGHYSQLQIDFCGIRDRCQPNFCEHGGQCSQSWSSFFCNCSGTGYTGVTCHNSIYERSCEGYRRAGSSSGYFSIDPDGSGGLGPTLVHCNITEDRAWAMVPHNNTELIRVKGSTPQMPFVIAFSYNASPKQLRSLVGWSEHCQQEVVYSCRKSRLFNTWDGTPLSWWRGRNGERHTYWGGFLPGVQQCACSLAGNCIDMNYFCNCDADKDMWVNDTGLLSYKDHLPLSEIAIGDTDRTGSEAKFKIGPLLCYGDRFFWNAASFYQESSYLHFPSNQAEGSTDISFYFKTMATSGIFMENLGVEDLIRLEMSSESTVTFTFDVGNGPSTLAVTSHVPLNDGQWHYVRAEHNVKEASLQVDRLPLRHLEAPSDGYHALQLSGQLFVGGSNSRRQGFLGCIRALGLNGLPLDLEGRAKMAPGVSPGCPGHCSSSGLCHNRGLCVEERSGFACDCTHSAYGGPRCEKEVSMSFESGSSVTYTFREPSSVVRDRGAPTSTVHREVSRSWENMAFSFWTTRAPALLLATNGGEQQYMAIILSRNGSLQIWYRLNRETRPDVFTPRFTSLANGQLHWVQLHRQGKDVYVQVDQDLNQKYTMSFDTKLNMIQSLTLGKVEGSEFMDEEVREAGSRGFIGCLSAVQFNQVAPLKAVMLNRGSSLVSVRGHLAESNCSGSLNMNTFTTTFSLSDHSEKVDRGKEPFKNTDHIHLVVIGGVTAAVVLVTLCLLGAMARFLCLRREPQQEATVEEKAHPCSLKTDYYTEVHAQGTGQDEREYYI